MNGNEQYIIDVIDTPLYMFNKFLSFFYTKLNLFQ